MKKFLSLVLALVMAMSLVTISAGAKDFNDNDAITYKEAVDVVSEAGIIDGYADGKFGPTANLTRGAAAKIICNMILGPTTAAELHADSAPYPDVPTNHTFAGYIAFCQKEGIISGYADGKFYPANPLTGYAFWKMLLGALGYNPDVEGYVGANWSINVAKQGLAIDLDDDLVDDFNGIDQVTREEACLYAFNALQAVMVDYSQKTEVNTGNAVVTISGNRYDESNNSKTDGYIEDDGLLQFAEKYFDDLEAIPTTDSFGRPATKWMWDGEKVGTYADAADDILVVGDAAKDLAQLITDGDYLDIDEDDVLASADVYYNGMYQGEYSKLAPNTDLAGKGDIIEVFENSKHDVDTIVIRSYTYAKIDKVDNDLSKTLKNKGATIEVELVDINDNPIGNGTYYDDHDDDEKVISGLNAETYEEDVVIAIALSTKDEIIDSYVVESVTGIPSAARAVEEYAYAGAVIRENDKKEPVGVKNGTITIEGTKYTYAAQMTGLDKDEEVDFDEEYVVYLTAEGYALAVDGDAVASLDDVYYLVGVYSDYVRGKAVVYAQVINAKDGTESELLLDDDKDGNKTEDLGKIALAADGKFVNVDGDGASISGFYVFDKDGSLYDVDKYTGTATYKTTEGVKLTSDVTRTSTVVRMTGAKSKLYIEDNTFFIAAEDVATDLEITTATGNMTADYTTKDLLVYAIYDDDDAVVVIYAAPEMAGATNKDDVVYLTDDVNTKTSKDTYVVDLVKMEDMETLEDVEIDKKGETTQGFWTYVLEDGVYELKNKAGKVDDLDVKEISDDSDGYDMAVVFEDVKNNTATGATYEYDKDGKRTETTITEYVAVSFADATVIDTRSGSAKKADIYSNEINTTSKLASAIDKGEVVADVYVEDGDIIFVAVVECADDTSAEGDDGKDDGKDEEKTGVTADVSGQTITVSGTAKDAIEVAKEIKTKLAALGYTNISVKVPAAGETLWTVTAEADGIEVPFDVEVPGTVIK